MKIQPTLIAIATSLLLASNFAVAESKHGKKDRHERPVRLNAAPEISVASGGSAIALLAGVLLLMGERTRVRRSS
jgi:hypothetical protein